MSSAIKQKTRGWINAQLGCDLNNLDKCEEIYKEWSDKKAELERTVSILIWSPGCDIT